MKMFLTEDEVLVKVKSLVKKYRCEIFNFVALCSGVGIVWSPKTQTWVSDATAVTFSVKCFDPLKLYPVSGKHLQKVVCFIIFIYSGTFNNNVISNGKSYYGKSYCCNNVVFIPVLAKNI